jgi:CheY-like chemotaxis protein
LIIEDNHSQQKVYQYWFSDYLCDFCDSISDALKRVTATDYDVILLDLHLGAKESGFSFLEALPRLKVQKIPESPSDYFGDGKPKVVVVSAYLDSLKEFVIEEKENVVWLTKEEATQERLIEAMKLKEDIMP